MSDRPFRPGDLRVVPSPPWGQARVESRTTPAITVLCSSDKVAAAAARMIVEHPNLVAEVGRLRAALARVTRMTPSCVVAEVANAALHGGDREAADDARIDAGGDDPSPPAPHTGCISAELTAQDLAVLTTLSGAGVLDRAG